MELSSESLSSIHNASSDPTSESAPILTSSLSLSPKTESFPVTASPRVYWPDTRPGAGTRPVPTSLLMNTNASMSPLLTPESSPVLSLLTETTPLIRRMSSQDSHLQSHWYNTCPHVHTDAHSHMPSGPLPHSHHTAHHDSNNFNFASNADAKLSTPSLSLMTVLTSTLPHTLWIAFRSIPAVLLGSGAYGYLDVLSFRIDANVPAACSSIIAQLVYTFGGSKFAGATGAMMIEIVVCSLPLSPPTPSNPQLQPTTKKLRALSDAPSSQPFCHILANTIRTQIGEENAREVIATTLAAYTLSSILTGLTFFFLGALKLGALIGSFPRHILVGCVGGIGAFLLRTGLTVSMRIDDDADWRMLERMVLDTRSFALWGVPLVLAVLLRVVTSRWSHPSIMPIYFLIIPVLFYIVVSALGTDLSDLRKAGWIFDMGTQESEAWYKVYSYWDFRAIRYGVLWDTLPTQFGLLFFNILHPSLNIPALSISLNEDVDMDKELVGHGYSNLLSAAFGTVPNYLVYVDSLLFYRVGGGTRIAGFMLAVMIAVLLIIGTAPIAFIPVMVVSALIFVLGIDLVKEALWDTRNRTTRTEYITIVGIVVVMTVWDFVTSVVFGIIASCFFFVIQNSQRRSIRSLSTGEDAISTVRRPSNQRAYLREVSKQTTIIKLQGFLFFGTISHVEGTIREIVNGPRWHVPISFLVLDLTLVAGVDMSSSEAFVRMHRFLSAKAVRMVFCGFSGDSPVAKALESVHVLGADYVEHFLALNDAIECE
ncbi:hypothetical protein C0995_012833 [Termitomyces sp. Mi166|nr:hypothetical protein C0995_012833 [Termitomyces sp. Mi166\